MEGFVFGIILAFLSFLILFFVVKSAVREGIKEAYDELKGNPNSSAAKTGEACEEIETKTEKKEEQANE